MSRFVSAGTDPDSRPPDDDAWLKARQEIELQKAPKKGDEGKQEGGKSLYEVLQANKAAKQEAFEESVRLKNQFRALDEDEVEFLDSVLESSRAKEEAVRQETAEQLEAFRKHRALADDALRGEPTGDEAGGLGAPVGENTWTMKKRKRRREKENEAGGDPGLKLRKVSSSADQQSALEHTESTVASTSTTSKQPDIEHSRDAARSAKTTDDGPTKAPTSVGLGLGNYSSEDEE